MTSKNGLDLQEQIIDSTELENLHFSSCGSFRERRHLTVAHIMRIFRSSTRRALMLTSWLFGLVAGYLVLKEGTLLLRQVRYSGGPNFWSTTRRAVR